MAPPKLLTGPGMKYQTAMIYVRGGKSVTATSGPGWKLAHVLPVHNHDVRVNNTRAISIGASVDLLVLLEPAQTSENYKFVVVGGDASAIIAEIEREVAAGWRVERTMPTEMYQDQGGRLFHNAVIVFVKEAA